MSTQNKIDISNFTPEATTRRIERRVLMKMKKKKVAASIAIIATLFLSINIFVQAYSIYDLVYLDYQQQEKSNWCWAACGSGYTHSWCETLYNIH